MWPILIGGYFLANGELLTPDILMTLFQTNMEEAKAYLEMQNAAHWCVALFLSCAAEILFLRLLSCYPSCKKSFSAKAIIYALLLAAAFGLAGGAVKSYEMNLVKMTWRGLQEYKAYSASKAERERRLAEMKDLSIASFHSGIYMLVIGESESRDHMSLYGYRRETTPWLTKFAKDPGTIVFSNAYSNHTHTVPTLTYALSEKNQYNNKKLAEAYSLVEVAKAAGYKVYWISNQVKYGAWDTPVAEIASTADYQYWMNSNVGETSQTAYYDGQLAEKIPADIDAGNTLVIVHLMGCHGWYGDRYPNQFRKFSGGKRVLDAYDNSVFYNDFVLEKLYMAASRCPRFNGFLYFSDHGDDAERGLGHEATKFTFTMSHIPLLMNFSERFIGNNPDLYQNLRAHEASYWTNDLLYDVMLDILGIQGAPAAEPRLSLASSLYDRTKENAVTLHGKKKISEDI